VGRIVYVQLGRYSCRGKAKVYQVVIAMTVLNFMSRHRPRKRAIQYSEASAIEPRSCGVLDNPLEPVIGLAGGETRWRSMTASCEAWLFENRIGK
jgi:hypothetical protein